MPFAFAYCQVKDRIFLLGFLYPNVCSSLRMFDSLRVYNKQNHNVCNIWVPMVLLKHNNKQRYNVINTHLFIISIAVCKFVLVFAVLIDMIIDLVLSFICWLYCSIYYCEFRLCFSSQRKMPQLDIRETIFKKKIRKERRSKLQRVINKTNS